MLDNKKTDTYDLIELQDTGVDTRGKIFYPYFSLIIFLLIFKFFLGVIPIKDTGIQCTKRDLITMVNVSC